MKIVLYDPLYSKIGHYERYSKYLVELFDGNEDVSEIIVFAEHPDLNNLIAISPKVSIVNHKQIGDFDRNDIQDNILKSVSNRIAEYKNYKKVISKINDINCDYVFFSSQGNLSFWVAVKALKKKYIVSVISIRWLYLSKGIKSILKKIYVEFIKKALLNVFTETMYADVAKVFLIQESKLLVLPDRYLYDVKVDELDNEIIKMNTFGTIVMFKSPINFLETWIRVSPDILSNFSYEMHGKVKHYELLVKLEKYSSLNVNFALYNSYLSETEYNTLFHESDFIVIPYPFEYTKHSTSGVMWDCFEKKKAILCPNIEPFRYYVNKYKIGYLYNLERLDDTLSQIVKERASFNADLQVRYKELEADFSKNKMITKLSVAINGI